MEIKFQELEHFFQKVPSHINAALLYGSDEGLIFAGMKKILHIICKTAQYSKSYIEQEYKEVKDFVALKDEALSISLFDPGVKVLILKNLSDNISKNCRNIIIELNSAKCFMIFAAPELKKNSATFLFLSKLKNLISIPCYLQEKQYIEQTIKRIFLKNQVEYDSAVPKVLSSLLPAQYMLAYNEIQKLLLYKLKLNTKLDPINIYDRITLEDLDKVFNEEASDISPDEIFLYFINGEIDKVQCDMRNLKTQNVNIILFVKLMQNYLTRILYIKAEISNGSSKEQAINKIKPPVFWKYKAKLARACDKISFLQIKAILIKLIQLELDCKKNFKMQSILLENFLTSWRYRD